VKDVKINEAQDEMENELTEFSVGHGGVLISGFTYGCIWVEVLLL